MSTVLDPFPDSPTWRDWYAGALEHLVGAGVEVVFSAGGTASYFHAKASGNVRLRVNTGTAEWRATFIHEYRHFLQHQADTYRWPDADPYKAAMEDLSAAPAWAVREILDCEWDAERYTYRVVNDVWGQDSAKEYSAMASAYLTFWYHCNLFRKWPKILPDDDPAVRAFLSDGGPAPATDPAAGQALVAAVKRAKREARNAKRR